MKRSSLKFAKLLLAIMVLVNAGVAWGFNADHHLLLSSDAMAMPMDSADLHGVHVMSTDCDPGEPCNMHCLVLCAMASAIHMRSPIAPSAVVEDHPESKTSVAAHRSRPPGQPFRPPIA